MRANANACDDDVFAERESLGALDAPVTTRTRRRAFAIASTTIACSQRGHERTHARASQTACSYFDFYNRGVDAEWTRALEWREGTTASGTFARVVGDYAEAKKAHKAPILVVNNGPGISMAYMAGVEVVSGEARGARECVAYDQIGCGRTPRRGEGDIEAYIAQADELARDLALTSEGGAHVVAHGYWGAKIAIEIARARPGLAKSITLVSAAPSYAAQVNDWRRALNEISVDAREAIETYERDLAPSARRAYDEGMKEFSERFVSRRSDGACFAAALAPASSDDLRLAITGGRYFTRAGSLADDAIDVNGLGAKLWANGVRSMRVVRGEFDAVSASSARALADAINADVTSASNFCAYDEVQGAASCVFLDRGDYFFERLNADAEANDA